MIFPDAESVLALGAFLSHAGTHHLGQAIDIERHQSESPLDLGSQRLGPRLGTEDADFQGARARVHSLPLHFVRDGQHVSRSYHDDARSKITDQLNLPLGLPP